MNHCVQFLITKQSFLSEECSDLFQTIRRDSRTLYGTLNSKRQMMQKQRGKASGGEFSGKF